jgi:hypothetical protein
MIKKIFLINACIIKSFYKLVIIIYGYFSKTTILIFSMLFATVGLNPKQHVRCKIVHTHTHIYILNKISKYL